MYQLIYNGNDTIEQKNYLTFNENEQKKCPTREWWPR